MSLLAKLLALANRPGTPAEGALARAHAERVAASEGAEVVESASGTLLSLDSFHADLRRALADIARGGRRAGGTLDEGPQ